MGKADARQGENGVPATIERRVQGAIRGVPRYKQLVENTYRGVEIAHGHNLVIRLHHDGIEFGPLSAERIHGVPGGLAALADLTETAFATVHIAIGLEAAQDRRTWYE